MFGVLGVQANNAVPAEWRDDTPGGLIEFILAFETMLVMLALALLEIIHIAVLVEALLSGAAGLSVLLPAIIRRIPKKVVRRTVGWTTGVAAAVAVPFFCLMFFFAALSAFGINDTVKIVAADGQSVLITQDGFDGDIINVYTEHHAFRYKLVRNNPEIPTWPRVKDQNCQLDTADSKLQLLCGDKTVTVEQDDPGK